MEPTEEELRQRYESLETAELVDLYRRGDLTERASSVMRSVLDSRGTSVEESGRLVDTENSREEGTIRPVSTPLPKLWIGYVIAVVFIVYAIAEIVLDPASVEEISLGPFLVAVAGWLYWLFCVYRIHWVLAEATNNHYPITPGKGAAFNLIPFFNLYWFFKWPNEIAAFLNRQSKKLVLPKGGPGFIILVGFLVTRFDTFLGLVVLFSVLVWICRKVREVIEFELPDAAQTS